MKTEYFLSVTNYFKFQKVSVNFHEKYYRKLFSFCFFKGAMGSARYMAIARRKSEAGARCATAKSHRSGAVKFHERDAMMLSSRKRRLAASEASKK